MIHWDILGIVILLFLCLFIFCGVAIEAITDGSSELGTNGTCQQAAMTMKIIDQNEIHRGWKIFCTMLEGYETWKIVRVKEEISLPGSYHCLYNRRKKSDPFQYSINQEFLVCCSGCCVEVRRVRRR